MISVHYFPNNLRVRFTQFKIAAAGVLMRSLWACGLSAGARARREGERYRDIGRGLPIGPTKHSSDTPPGSPHGRTPRWRLSQDGLLEWRLLRVCVLRSELNCERTFKRRLVNEEDAKEKGRGRGEPTGELSDACSEGNRRVAGSSECCGAFRVLCSEGGGRGLCGHVDARGVYEKSVRDEE